MTGGTAMGNKPGTKGRVATQGLAAIRLAIACSAVSVAVTAQAAPLTLQLGSAQGLAGQTVSVDVTIQNIQNAEDVQNDVGFTDAAPIAATPSQQPVCALNSNLPGGSFSFLPFGCVPGLTCTGVRASVFAFPSLPLSNGDVLYTCKVAISPTAADGAYPLHGTNAFASDEFGDEIATQIVDGMVTVGPTIHNAPASLILRSARLKASPGIRLGRGLGSADIDAVVDTNPPFGGLIDDIQAGGLTLNFATDGAAFALSWTAAECAFQQTPHGPSIRCEADDVTSHRIVTLHPTRLPNVLAMKLRARRINLRPPLTSAPVDVSVVTATFQRPDDIGDCVVMGADQDRKICREVGVQPSATPTASATGTVASTGTATGTVTWTLTITRIPTATSTSTVPMATKTPTMPGPTATPTMPGPTATPTATSATATPAPTGAGLTRVFNIDPGLGQSSSPTQSASGLFSTGLTGANVADRISSGPLTLVMGAPDVSGIAPLSLQDDVTISVDVTADKTCLCLKLLAAGQTGSISCNGGGSLDTQAERSASQPSTDISWVATGGLPSTNAPPGSAILLVKANFENVADNSGMMGFPCDHIDCATHTYTGQPTPLNTFAFTTTTATAIQDTSGAPIKLPDPSVPAYNPANFMGQPFDCANFTTPGSGGRLVAPAPASIVILTANLFRFAEQ